MIIGLGQDVMCAQDARMCPDGSFVGRVGPDCEFTPCPTDWEALQRQVKDLPPFTTGIPPINKTNLLIVGVALLALVFMFRR